MDGRLDTELRRAARMPLRCTMALTLDCGKSMAGKTVDISDTGVGVLLPAAVRPGQIGQMQIQMLSFGEMVVVRAKFIAVHCVLSHDEFRLGLQFLGMSPQMRKAIYDVLI